MNRRKTMAGGKVKADAAFDAAKRARLARAFALGRAASAEKSEEFAGKDLLKAPYGCKE